MNKRIAVVGLGLIGGSFAKAIKQNTAHTVYGYDINKSVLFRSQADEAIDYPLDENTFSLCDTFIIALYPESTKQFVLENINRFKSGTVIIDTGGIKGYICDALSEITTEHGIYFIGGHPMAGIEKSGYENSFADMFSGATMILCKDANTNTVALKACEMLFLSIGFGNITVTTAAEHDKTIAFTSQLAHIVSNAYIKSETAKMQLGFSAGSYKDLTRVAMLNEKMWTELFFENKNNIKHEIDTLIERLSKYSKALENNDTAGMEELLKEGRIAKEMIG